MNKSHSPFFPVPSVYSLLYHFFPSAVPPFLFYFLFFSGSLPSSSHSLNLDRPYLVSILLFSLLSTPAPPSFPIISSLFPLPLSPFPLRPPRFPPSHKSLAPSPSPFSLPAPCPSHPHHPLFPPQPPSKTPIGAPHISQGDSRVCWRV